MCLLQAAVVVSRISSSTLAAALRQLYLRNRIVASCALWPSAAYLTTASPDAGSSGVLYDACVVSRVSLPTPFVVAAVVSATVGPPAIDCLPAAVAPSRSSSSACVVVWRALVCVTVADDGSVQVQCRLPAVDRLLDSEDGVGGGSVAWSSSLWDASACGTPFIATLQSRCQAVMDATLSLPLLLHEMVTVWQLHLGASTEDGAAPAFKRRRE